MLQLRRSNPAAAWKAMSYKAVALVGGLAVALVLSDQPSDEVADEDSLFIPVPHPFVVKLEPTRGQLQLASKEILYLSPQTGHLRLSLDLSGLHHQIRETSYHFQQRLFPKIKEEVIPGMTLITECKEKSAGSLLSAHSVLMQKLGEPRGGHHGEDLQSKTGRHPNLAENCTKISQNDVDHLHGQHHYSHDIAMKMLSRQSLSCVQGLEDQLIRFSHTQSHEGWSKNPGKRQAFLGLLGLGVSLAFGLSNRAQISKLGDEMSSLDHQVQAVVGEQRLMADITGGLISAQANLQKEVMAGKEMEQRTDSLAKMNALTQVSCQMSQDLRHGLTELKEHRFPTDLFGQEELNTFLTEFMEKVSVTNLEPVFPGTAALFNTKVYSYVESFDLPEVENEAEAEDKGRAGTEVKVHRWNSTNGLYRHKLRTKVVLTKSSQESAAATWNHNSHDFPKSVFKKDRQGLKLHLLVPIPLKVKDSGGFRVYRLADTMMTLERKNVTELLEDSAVQGPSHPLPIIPDLTNGLLAPLTQALGLVLHEVGQEFLSGCDSYIDGQVLICGGNIPPSPGTCLIDIFRNQVHSKACLQHYKTLDENSPHIKPITPGTVQVFVPPGGQLATVCPRGQPPQLEPVSAGLYKCQLPITCSVQVGKVAYTNLGEQESEAHVMFEKDFEELRQLAKISDVENKEGWERLHQLKREMEGQTVNLAHLQDRLEESLPNRWAREYATHFSWFASTGVLVLMLLILAMAAFGYWMYRRRQRQAQQEANRLARQNWLLMEHFPQQGRLPQVDPLIRALPLAAEAVV